MIPYRVIPGLKACRLGAGECRTPMGQKCPDPLCDWHQIDDMVLVPAEVSNKQPQRALGLRIAIAQASTLIARGDISEAQHILRCALLGVDPKEASTDDFARFPEVSKDDFTSLPIDEERPSRFDPKDFKIVKPLDFDTMRAVNQRRSAEGFKHTLDAWTEAEWSNAFAGEVGEALEAVLEFVRHGLLACNVAKKISRFRIGAAGNKGKSREELIDEIAHEGAGSVLYLDHLFASLGIDLGEAIRKEFNKKSAELGSGVRL